MTTNRFIEDLTLVPLPLWWQNPWVWVGLSVLLAIAAYVARRAWLARPRPAVSVLQSPPGPPPHLEALRRLQALRSDHSRLSENEVALEWSDILRGYIHQRFGVPIRFLTTREFLGAALADPLLEGAARVELGEFLHFFDGLKFARDAAEPEATLASIDGAERFVRRCIPPAVKEGAS